ncbi:MAG: ATP-grasp domain-containing protein [Gammaproteobacteria bacterium]
MLDTVLASAKIAVVTDDPGWHGRELQEAFAARGFVTRFLSLIECRLDLSRSLARIVLPGFEEALPPGVFVRGVPGGTLEQVIHRLDVLHWLGEAGVVVYNDGRSIERTVDKAMTSFLLKRAGVPIPETWVCESDHHARALLMSELSQGRRLVMKPLFGSQGEGVALLRRPEGLPDAAAYGGVYYLQRFVPPEPGADCRDWRVFIIGGRAQAAMIRRSRHWVTNRARGGICEPAPLDLELVGLAEAAARALEIDYAGVDLLRDERGRYLVTEVNSVPAWRGLQEVCAFRIAERLAERFLSQVTGVLRDCARAGSCKEQGEYHGHVGARPLNALSTGIPAVFDSSIGDGYTHPT